MKAAVGKFWVPFCLKFQPLVDGIMEKEAALHKLMENTTMAQILGLAHAIGAHLGVAC